MKHIIIGSSYNLIAIPLNAESAKLLPILADAFWVDSSGYGAERKFIPKPESMQIELTDAVVARDELSIIRAQLEESEKARRSMESYWESARKERDALKAQLAEKLANKEDTI